MNIISLSTIMRTFWLIFKIPIVFRTISLFCKYLINRCTQEAIGRFTLPDWSKIIHLKIVSLKVTCINEKLIYRSFSLIREILVYIIEFSWPCWTWMCFNCLDGQNILTVFCLIFCVAFFCYQNIPFSTAPWRYRNRVQEC